MGELKKNEEKEMQSYHSFINQPHTGITLQDSVKLLFYFHKLNYLTSESLLNLIIVYIRMNISIHCKM
jgi:hypothetical protein